jgi:hypothetical protein
MEDARAKRDLADMHAFGAGELAAVHEAGAA